MPPTETPLDLERLIADIADVVREGGAIAAGMFRTDVERWTKSDDSPVTAADLAVDRFLAERLPPLVDGSGWLSEETADTPERLERRRVWVVDPIDGTRAFVEGLPEWVVSVALVEDGEAVAGVVYDACRDICFAATRGGGATCDGRPMIVADSQTLEGLVVGGPISLLGPLARHGVVKAPWTYALAKRLVRVAAGDLDAALARPNAHDWDIAAADIILAEAGAKLTGFDGARPAYNRRSTRQSGLVAAAPRRHAALLAALEDADAALPATESAP